MSFKVAIVGATGNVGHEMLDILAERAFPVSEVVALASSRSVGTEVSFGDKTLKVKALEHYDFSDTDICLMSAGGAVSKEWSPKIGAQGAVVIDNSSTWRMHPDVPLIVPEVNAAAAAGFSKMNIIANPNCSTAQLVVALKPLHERFGVKRVVVSTYQSVSGAGKEAMDELFNQTRSVFAAGEVEAKKFSKRIAFNVIPHIDVFMEDGFTKEEWKMMAETKKILDPKIKLTATCVRVPVFIGHTPRASTSSARSRSPPTRPARSCAPPPASSSSTSMNPVATSPRTRRLARTRPISRASARMPRSRTASPSGAFRTICARAPRSTRSRSPRCWSTAS